MTTSGPADASSPTISVFAAASVSPDPPRTAAKEQNRVSAVLPEIAGTIRRRAEAAWLAWSLPPRGWSSSGHASASPLTPMIARSTVKVLSRRLVQASTAAEVKPLIVPGSGKDAEVVVVSQILSCWEVVGHHSEAAILRHRLAQSKVREPESSTTTPSASSPRRPGVR